MEASDPLELLRDVSGVFAEAARRGSGQERPLEDLDVCAATSAEGRTNPALSRNLNPPPSGGGVFRPAAVDPGNAEILALLV